MNFSKSEEAVHILLLFPIENVTTEAYIKIPQRNIKKFQYKVKQVASKGGALFSHFWKTEQNSQITSMGDCFHCFQEFAAEIDFKSVYMLSFLSEYLQNSHLLSIWTISA